MIFFHCSPRGAHRRLPLHVTIGVVGELSLIHIYFVVPLISEVYDDANSQLASTQSSWDIAVVEVPGIPPGTPNLGPYQTGAGPLAALTDQPLRIDWKPAGDDPSYYRLVTNYEVLPDLQPREGIAGWEFRSEVIWLTNSSIAVDLLSLIHI